MLDYGEGITAFVFLPIVFVRESSALATARVSFVVVCLGEVKRAEHLGLSGTRVMVIVDRCLVKIQGR